MSLKKILEVRKAKKNTIQTVVAPSVHYAPSNDENDLSRLIAEQILARNLYENEVVHHIDGNGMSNDPSNLCVMDSLKHEQFHAWLRWKKQKSGFYPNRQVIRRELEGDVYCGIILD